MSLIHNFGWVGLPPSAAMEVERVEERCQVPFFGHPQFRVVLFSPNHATAFGPLSRRPVWRAQFHALRTSSMLFIHAKKLTPFSPYGTDCFPPCLVAAPPRCATRLSVGTWMVFAPRAAENGTWITAKRSPNIRAGGNRLMASPSRFARTACSGPAHRPFAELACVFIARVCRRMGHGRGRTQRHKSRPETAGTMCPPH